MASYNDPKVTNAILQDVPAIRELIRSLAAMNPAGGGHSDIPAGAIQLVPVNGGMQFRRFSSDSWQQITERFGIDVEKLGGYKPSTTAAPGTIPVYNSSGKLPGSITGNAETASKLETARKIDLGGFVAGTAVSFDGSKDITLNVTRIDVNNEADNVLNGIISKAHGGTGRNDGAAADVILANGGKASDYGQLGKSANITGKDLNSLVNAGNYFSSNGTISQHYPYNMGENIYVNVSEHGIYRKQVLCSENQFWVRDSKDSGASWSGWILLSASRENAFYIYISKSGSDSNSGLDSSNPVLTIARALSIAHKMYPYGLNKSVIFRCGSGDWGDIVLNSLPFLLEFSDYAYSDVSEYSETLPKFTSIYSKNSLVSIRNAVVQHIITDKSGTITTTGYIRFSRLTAQNFSLIYMAANTAEIYAMSGHTAVFYANQRGQIVSGTTSYKIIENLSLSVAFAGLYVGSVVNFNNASFALNSGVSVTGKRYAISTGADAIATKSYLDTLPGSSSGTIAVGGHIGGIPWGGGASDQALMADLSWKPVLLQTGGTVTGTLFSKWNGVLKETTPSSDISKFPMVVQDTNSEAIAYHALIQESSTGDNVYRSGINKGNLGCILDLRSDGSRAAISSNASLFYLGATPPDGVAGNAVITADWANRNIGSKLANYLPLSGGTFTNGTSINSLSDVFSITAGHNGGYLNIFTDAGTDQPGTTEIVARNSSGDIVHLIKASRRGCLADEAHIVRFINGIGAGVDGNINITNIRVNNANYSDVLTGVIAGYGGPITLPNYGSWAYVATTNYRGWGAGSSDGASYGGTAAGGTTINFDSRGTGYLCVRFA